MSASARRLPAAHPAPTPAPVPVHGAPAPSLAPPAGQRARPLAAPGPAPVPTAPSRPPVVAPLAPERYRVQFTASAETYAKLRLAQDLLRHQIPDGDIGQVLDRWARDEGRCAFVSRKGRRCAERGRLELHHVRPYAAGGPATVDNIQLRCRAHNGYEAAQLFGLFGPSLVREPARGYGARRRGVGPLGTRFGPSWTVAGRPP